MVLHTYKAILRGNRIEWSDTPPADLSTDHPVSVHVTILDAPDQAPITQSAGVEMAAILEQLAHASAFAQISDPAEWERDQRQDRHLPDRAA